MVVSVMVDKGSECPVGKAGSSELDLGQARLLGESTLKK
jgi:hypothetical protein